MNQFYNGLLFHLFPRQELSLDRFRGLALQNILDVQVLKLDRDRWLFNYFPEDGNFRDGRHFIYKYNLQLTGP